ncbi:hypothetical protein CVT24_012492 [Panaeolus cyanescens]|uniref:Uncharacterized protein n=1 Tax=Panaeolus cyanescens TaxID=181874 RepID=A0A409YK05_9AGAR|nr:hypothetical protein CVT24_012492 [Panaeolus cyanescens]
MFGCCVAGRLLQTNLIQVDETHAYFELPQAASINHVCVFLLGTVPFPEGYGATVHFFWPGKGFQLLGMISNEKPSAIFRLRGTFSATAPSTPSTTAQNTFTNIQQQQTQQQQQDITAILGIAIEPLGAIQAQMESVSFNPALNVSSQSASGIGQGLSDPTVLAEKIVKHMVNYVSGFLEGGVNPNAPVPMSLIAKWYETFLNKVRAGGVGFLERGE